MEDLGCVFGVALGVDPGHIAVDHQDDIRRLDAGVVSVAQTEPSRVVRREAHVAATCVQDTQTLDVVGQIHKLLHSGVIAACVASDDERLLRVDQRLSNGLDAARRQRRRFDRLPVV